MTWEDAVTRTMLISVTAFGTAVSVILSLAFPGSRFHPWDGGTMAVLRRMGGGWRNADRGGQD
jgi:hypothetical protein